jgi:hypothetical protein
MWQDFLSGLTLAAITGALYALATYFGQVSWSPGDDAWDLLVLVGIMLSVSGFLAEPRLTSEPELARGHGRDRRAQPALRRKHPRESYAAECP